MRRSVALQQSLKPALTAHVLLHGPLLSHVLLSEFVVMVAPLATDVPFVSRTAVGPLDDGVC